MWTTSGGAVLYALVAGLITAVLGRCCCSSKKYTAVADDVERGNAPAAVESIVASFDAWLFADSKVLWAVLISKIFDQVSRHRRC